MSSRAASGSRVAPAPHTDAHPVATYLREIADNLDLIFVRRQNAQGRWGNASLASLPVDECLAQLGAWIGEGRIPVRIRRATSEMRNG